MFRADQLAEQLGNHKKVGGWITMVSPCCRHPHPTPATKYTSKPVHESMGASFVYKSPAPKRNTQPSQAMVRQQLAQHN